MIGWNGLVIIFENRHYLWELRKNGVVTILQLSLIQPQSHVRILIYRTWAIVRASKIQKNQAIKTFKCKCFKMVNVLLTHPSASISTITTTIEKALYSEEVVDILAFLSRRQFNKTFSSVIHKYTHCLSAYKQ